MIIKLDHELTSPRDATVINLTEVRNRYRSDKCQHNRVQVDAELAEVECKHCGQMTRV